MAAIHSLHAKPLMSHTATGRPDVERQLFSFFFPPYIFFFYRHYGTQSLESLLK